MTEGDKCTLQYQIASVKSRQVPEGNTSHEIKMNSTGLLAGAKTIRHPIRKLNTKRGKQTNKTLLKSQLHKCTESKEK